MSAESPSSRSFLGLHRSLARLAIAGLILGLVGLSAGPASAQVEKPATKPPATKPATKPDTTPATKPAAKVGAEPGDEVPEKPAPPAETAKTYDEMKPDESLNRDRNQAYSDLRKGLSSEVLKNYFTKYEIPYWTVIADRTKVRDARFRLVTLLRQAGEPARGDLIRLLLQMMATIAQGDYNPVARVNAMLMIGEFDSVALPPGVNDDPTPLPAALPILITTVSDAKIPDAVRVAALLGIKRHAELSRSLAPAQQAAVVTALVGVITNEPAPGRTAAGHAWMRTLAIEALGALQVAGQAGEVANLLASIVGEAAAPFSVRCAAARALGQLNFGSPPGIVPATVTRQMGQLAVAVSKDELSREAAEEGSFSRRRVQSRLLPIYLGLSGIASTVSDPADVALHTAVLGDVKKCLEVLENKKAEDVEVIPQFSSQVDTLAGKLLAPAAKPAPKPE